MGEKKAKQRLLVRTHPLSPQRAGLPGGSVIRLLLALSLLSAALQAPLATTLGEVNEMARRGDR